MERLNKYFEKVIKEAYESEEREYAKNTSWFYVIVGNQILFSINTPYERVSRKARRRIENNITKNFSLSADGNFYLDSILQPNFICNVVKANGKSYYLCSKDSYDDNSNGEAMISGKYEKLIKAYHNITIDDYKKAPENYYLPHNISWEEYKETYKKAYGKYPGVDIKDTSDNVLVS
jgi:hypothetical protein